MSSDPPEDLTDAGDLVDELPADLDASAVAGPYLFPNTSRRRIAGLLYIAVGAACLAVAVLADGSPRVNAGVVIAGIALVVVGGHSIAVGWNTTVDEADALEIAARVVGFAVGPASAQMVWRGWRSRPSWRVLVYSHEPQPSTRALVVVDAVDGSVIEQLVEDNPEDWAALR